MIDIGVNLTNARFDKDRDAVIERALASGVTKQLLTGTCIDTSQQALSLAKQVHRVLYSTAGIHPHDADNAPTDFIDKLRLLLRENEVKAVGECGLDFNRNFSTPENQKHVFEAQVVLAAELGMPLFLHQRDAFDEWLSILSPFLESVPAMVSHCFTGDEQQLKSCLDNGMYVGITGWVCDKKRGQELRDIVKYIPLDRLMLETDAPYLTPQNIRPKPKSSRNEPAYLAYVVTMIAEHSCYTEQQIIEASTNNATRVFNLHD